MGQPKPELRLVPGGPRLLDIAALVASQISDDAFIVARGGMVSEPTLPVEPDRFGDSGVLGALATALAHARHDRVVVVAADMPFLAAAPLRRVAQLPSEAEALVPRVIDQETGVVITHPLHAGYRTTCLPVAVDLIDAGYRRLSDLLERIAVHVIGEADLRGLDPDLRFLTNVNTPADVEQARASVPDAGAHVTPGPGTTSLADVSS